MPKNAPSPDDHLFDDPPAAADEGPPLEDVLGALDGILDRLETGELPLDEAIRLYEEGVQLARRADSQLSAAELRVRQIDGE